MDSNASVQMHTDAIVEAPILSRHFHLPRVILILIVALLSAGVFGIIGYYLGLSHQVNPYLQQTKYTQAKPSIIISPPNSPTPMSSQRPDNFLLATIWQQGTSQYSNTLINITFQYPKSFTSQVVDTSNYVGSSIPRPLLSLQLDTPDVPQSIKNKPGFDWNTYDDNSMHVYIDVYNNTNNQTLDTFLNTLYAGPGIDGKTPMITTLRNNLVSSDVPKSGSFVYVGTLGENPMKAYYFTNGDKIYVFRLVGGNDTGASYTKDAENVFMNIINSIVFK